MSDNIRSIDFSTIQEDLKKCGSSKVSDPHN